MATRPPVRRSNSTTSLSKYFHDLPDPDQTSPAFCNSFWGPNDCGVQVLFARMRGAARTMEELRDFWKERIAIEAEYVKKLAKLAQRPLGRDEIGGFRSALDKLRLETDAQAAQHLDFVHTMKRELEKTSNEFIDKQNNHKMTFQAAIEKSYKTKQFQERNVERAQEKYESDSALVDSYTTQLALAEGDAREDVQAKLERAERDAQARQKDYKNFTRTLGDSCKRWEREWKTYCDQCQDLEDERLDFIRDNVWAYANAVSTVCVSDDESCERIRIELEEVEADQELENFVNDYGTGAMISEPIGLKLHGEGDAIHRPKQKVARFARNSARGVSSSTQATSSVGVFGVGTTGPGLTDVYANPDFGLGGTPLLPPLPLPPPFAPLNFPTPSLLLQAQENNVNSDTLEEPDVEPKVGVHTESESRRRVWDLTDASRWIGTIHAGFLALNHRDIAKLLTIALLAAMVRKIDEQPFVYFAKRDTDSAGGPACG